MGHEVEETVWIAMPDGARLAARIWRPALAEPVPAVLEFLPYRRRDGTVARDDSTYPAFAEAGIAGVRVDSRGMGDSDGLFDDEYSPQELADAVATIAWIAAQPWCSGRVGMMGISWGGFNALQVAALRPPALKAVISIASTVDRFADDIHFKGGWPLGANLSWAATMLAYTSRPPDPAVVGRGWRAIWRRRLQAEPFLIDRWLGQQRRGAYWRHGSVAEDFGAIQMPVWIIAGWNDGYRNAPAALLAGMAGGGAPVKAMVGPWVHKYPHFAWPRPRADFTGMAIDWWRRWLEDRPTGVEAWPAYRAFLTTGAPPGPRLDEPGDWVGLEAWPLPDAGGLTLGLSADGALVRPGADPAPGPGAGGDATSGPIRIATPADCGTAAGEYFALAPDGDLPGDQWPDDARAACWDGPPLAEPLAILGRPTLAARVALDRPVGVLVARLVDLHPDGRATLIARGVLNLCHRDGHAAPAPMEPGVALPVTLALDETGYRLPAGHRLRLALSTAYWPYLLPAPAPVVATLAPGAELRLPLVPASARPAPPPAPADPDPLPRHPALSPPETRREVTRCLETGRVTYRILQDGGLTRVPGHAMEVREIRDETWTIDPADPLSARARLVQTTLRQRGDWRAETRAEIGFRADAGAFHLTGRLTAEDTDGPVIERLWSETIARDHC